jgi:hypothetical protein
MTTILRLRTLLQAVPALCLALLACAPALASTWPSVALPAGATAFEVGEQLSVNGMPMRLRGFVTRSAPLDTAAWFRNSLGQPVVENRLMGKLVLGRAQGDYYISVLIEALPGSHGTRGTVTVSDVKAAYERRADTRAVDERMLARLPYGSRLVSQMRSTDHGRVSAYVQAENGHSQQLNRDYLVRQLETEGYRLEREGIPDLKRAPALPQRLADGRTLFFKGRNGEATAVIRAGARAGVTSIVINTVNSMEQVE